MENAENVLIPIVAIIFTFGSAFGIVYYYLHTRNKQRLAMIEKGVDPNLFCVKSSVNKYSVLKWGLLLIGIAVGLFLSSIVDHYTELNEGAQFAMVLLFGGLGLLTYYFIPKKDAQGGDK